MKRKTHRPGEIDVMYFDKLPQRCKEMLFEFLSCESPYDIENKAFFIDVGTLYNEDCKSPIEQIFCLAFEMACFARNFNLMTYITLHPQADIYVQDKHYIADFVFDTGEIEIEDVEAKFKPLKLVIECDGHESHNSTKEQVKRDNQRDYDLKMVGYEVLHFSGSQIFNEPFKCADETLDFIISQITK